MLGCDSVNSYGAPRAPLRAGVKVRSEHPPSEDDVGADVHLSLLQFTDHIPNLKNDARRGSQATRRRSPRAISFFDFLFQIGRSGGEYKVDPHFATRTKSWGTVENLGGLPRIIAAWQRPCAVVGLMWEFVFAWSATKLA